MKVAISHWQNRISPVLDASENFLIVEISDHQPVESNHVSLSNQSPVERVQYLKTSGCTVLLCGAASGWCRQQYFTHGIEVISWLRGNVDRILRAFLDGSLQQDEHIMPGCGRRGRRQRHGKRSQRKRRRNLC